MAGKAASEAVEGLLSHFGMVNEETWESVVEIIEGDLSAKGVRASVVGIRGGVVTVSCRSAEVMLVRFDSERLADLVAKKHPKITKISVVADAAP